MRSPSILAEESMPTPASDYAPRPPDTSGITLPADLEELIERLAGALHDVWAKQRIDQGWTYGPVRDDAARTHPDLIPYSALSEEEKEYDRQAAIQTLKGIMALGYTIRKASPRDGDAD